jgi:hypothetical protein
MMTNHIYFGNDGNVYEDNGYSVMAIGKQIVAIEDPILGKKEVLESFFKQCGSNPFPDGLAAIAGTATTAVMSDHKHGAAILTQGSIPRQFSNQEMEGIKTMVAALPMDRQKELFTFMYESLNCRMFKD